MASFGFTRAPVGSAQAAPDCVYVVVTGSEPVTSVLPSASTEEPLSVMLSTTYLWNQSGASLVWPFGAQLTGKHNAEFERTVIVLTLAGVHSAFRYLTVVVAPDSLRMVLSRGRHMGDSPSPLASTRLARRCHPNETDGSGSGLPSLPPTPECVMDVSCRISPAACPEPVRP